MKQRKLFYLSPVALLLLTGCKIFGNSSYNPSGEPNSYSEPPISIINSEDPVIPPDDDYLKFWNPNTKLEFDIQMSKEAAEFIDQHQSNHDDSTYFDYYVPCTLTLKINDKSETIEEVGIRQKGNMSRTNMLKDGNFSLEEDFMAHYKLSFKETFDDDEYTSISILNPFKKEWTDDSERKARKNRTLFGMEKVDMKWNRNNDETKTKQAYTLKTFRENGVLTGHDNLANVSLSIKGKTGITATYEILECIDSVFIKRHFGEEDADGDLYKCSYTSTGPADFTRYTIGEQVGVEDNTKKYHPTYDLKTNKKKNKTHDALMNFIKVVNDTTSNAATYKEKIEEVFDMNSFIMYESIAYLAGNFDDFRNNANNYYLYFPNTSKKAYIIPYDFDRCFGAGCEGRKDYMTSFSPESTKMQCSGNWQTNNLYWRSICQNTSQKNVERVEEYRALYQKNIEDLLNNSTISTESFTTYVNSFPALYRGNPDGAGKENTTFSNYLSKKIAAIKDNCPNYDIK